MAMLRKIHALVLGLTAGVARGDSFEFEAMPVPKGKVVQALYRFYIYIGKDVPDEIKGQPYVDFENLSANVSDLVIAEGSHESLELSIMPYNEFWNFIDPEKFCSTYEDIVAKRSKKANTLMVQKPSGVDPKELGVYTYTVPLVGAAVPVNPQTRFNVSKTDVYALVISNCGDIEEATITGEVTLRNAFGYLPGDQYYKMAFYGLLSISYIVLSVLWFLLAVHWWKGGERLHHLHHCITFVLFLGVIESVLSWFFLFDWNRSSERPEILFLFNICVSVAKPAFSYALVLITGLGWGITRPNLELVTMRKVQTLLFLYCVAHVIWEFLSFFRHSYDISSKVLFATYSPALLVTAFLLCWMLVALRKITEDVEGESRSLFKKIRAIVVLGVLAAVPATALQLLELGGTLGEDLLPSRTAFKWHYQWFLFDAMGQIIYFMVFTAVMCQWAPQNKTQRYLYAEQLDQDEEGDAPAPVGKEDMIADAPADAYAIGGDEEEEEEPEDLEVDVGGANTNAPGPQKLGASS